MRDDGSAAGPSGDASSSTGDHPRLNGTNGVKPAGMRTRPIPIDEVAEHDEALDLVAVQADDELISALSARQTVAAAGHLGPDDDERVSAVLAAWKAEVDARPIPELVDLDTAVATVLAARPPARAARPPRRLAPVAAAAAFVVLACGGISVGSYSAEPDDALWGVSKVLFSERAESVEAAGRVEERISRAKQALAEGRPDAAARELREARGDLGEVRPEQGHTQLVDVAQFLAAKAQESVPGVPVDPGAPLATEPTRRVPPGAAAKARASSSSSTSPPATSSSVPPVTGSTDPVSPLLLPDAAPGAGGGTTDPSTSESGPTEPAGTSGETTSGGTGPPVTPRGAVPDPESVLPPSPTGSGAQGAQSGTSTGGGTTTGTTGASGTTTPGGTTTGTTTATTS